MIYRILIPAAALALITGTVDLRAQDAPEGKQRVGTVRLAPGSKEAINKGLEYLAKDQNDDGSFGSSNHPAGDTALSVMAFMLQGHVPGRGTYGRKMDNGITFLLSIGEKQRGYMGTPRNHAGMYEHGLAVLCLSEAWGQSKNRKIRQALRKILRRHKTGNVAIIVPEPLATLVRGEVTREPLGDLWEAECAGGNWEFLDHTENHVETQLEKKTKAS